MRVLFVLPGLHRVDRGAEVAFIEVAERLAKRHEVTLMGGGTQREKASYKFISVPCVDRARFRRAPSLPAFRNDTAYEDLTFALGMIGRYRPSDYDVTLTCNYPFSNWALRVPGTKRPPHVYVTQNGDWPATSNDSEFRFFSCDALVCTNPDFYDRNKARWNCSLIPNGVDCSRFVPGRPDKARFGLPDMPVVLMVSALIPTKRVEAGIRAMEGIPGVCLAVAGDGPLREEIEELGNRLLPGRFRRLSLSKDEMPGLYASADALLHLSYEEAFGNVFVEALSCGLPVIGHDIPRLRWIVGDDEHLVDTNDASLLRDAIRAALLDPQAKRDARVARAKRFDWDGIADEYEAVLKKVSAHG